MQRPVNRWSADGLSFATGENPDEFRVLMSSR